MPEAPSSPDFGRSFSQEERDLIVRTYFRAEAPDEDDELCPRCAESLDFCLRPDEDGSARLAVRCRGCSRGFEWRTRSESEEWKDLHWAYFIECRRRGRPVRCPIDDSSIICREHNDGQIEFRCPFCNRFGRRREENARRVSGKKQNPGTSS